MVQATGRSAPESARTLFQRAADPSRGKQGKGVGKGRWWWCGRGANRHGSQSTFQVEVDVEGWRRWEGERQGQRECVCGGMRVTARAARD